MPGAQEPGKIYIVLEYCRGGDLSMYLQKRHGRIPETTAKHFMQQLASGLQVLRENNLIHRDLKPQNLLLSTNDENSILKIADFGFARSLQPRGLAETLCGSPLYMAPEIMQLQKYDAKADLWSVGAILFQLVTGRTPFTGNNQIQVYSYYIMIYYLVAHST
nr:serine/threonine-protein kinase ATG1c-like isoform X2 [Ipomoea batatas]